MSNLPLLPAPSRRIAMLNDLLRTTMHGGTVCVTTGVYVLGEEFVLDALAHVKHFTGFTVENDPHEEHDFGEVTVRGRTLFWKIDYLDLDMVHGSDDPSDPKVTNRVLTIMLEEDY